MREELGVKCHYGVNGVSDDLMGRCGFVGLSAAGHCELSHYSPQTAGVSVDAILDFPLYIVGMGA